MSQDLIAEEQLKFLVVDDHEAMRDSTVQAIKAKYPEAKIYTAKTAEETRLKINSFKPHLITLDLQIPEKTGDESIIQTGVDLLEELLDNKNLALNIVVVSANLPALIRLKDKINNYDGGGFGANDKMSIPGLLEKIDIALKEGTHTKDIPGFRDNITVKPDWLKVLQLASDEELTDEAIANKIGSSLRTVRNHWSKLYDVFDVYPEDNINRRVRTIKRAIQKGFLDVD